jgi:Flp pilus assembly protein CpaB
MPDIRDLVVRLGGWPRRLLALCCLLLALASALAARSGSTSATAVGHSTVLVAARDLSAGTILNAAQLRPVRWPDDLRPPNALSTTAAATGYRLITAVRAGEAITASRLLGSGLTSGLPAGLAATSVVLDSAVAPTLIRPGDAIDLMAATGSAVDGSTSAQLLAHAVRVLATGPPPTDSAGAVASGPTVIVAVDRATALRITAALGSRILATVQDHL